MARTPPPPPTMFVSECAGKGHVSGLYKALNKGRQQHTTEATRNTDGSFKERLRECIYFTQFAPRQKSTLDNVVGQGIFYPLEH